MKSATGIYEIINELTYLQMTISANIHEIMKQKTVTDKDFYKVRYMQLVDKWCQQMIKDFKEMV